MSVFDFYVVTALILASIIYVAFCFGYASGEGHQRIISKLHISIIANCNNITLNCIKGDAVRNLPTFKQILNLVDMQIQNNKSFVE